VKIVSIIGARPQFIKAAAVSRKLRERHTEILVHTGQHYDYEMSGVFFDGLDLPTPDVNLEVGSGSHGAQTSAMLSGVESVLLAERPDCLLIYGDTNSTLAGALAASKLLIPIVHVEAGLRSFNRAMPEEINRVVADHLSSALLCPSDTAVHNLAAEGVTANVHLVGDVMLDALTWANQRVTDRRSEILSRFGVRSNAFLLATVHRAENADDAPRLTAILKALDDIGEPVIFPVHPRTRSRIRESGHRPSPLVQLVDPVGYLEMVALAGAARLVLTDSGGLQKEAYWLKVPCITLRGETEWVETVETGWNVLAGADRHRIGMAVRSAVAPGSHPALYGDGHASTRCVEIVGSMSVAQTV
jgi:UDP-GlcNAc3NAcA epimerase